MARINSNIPSLIAQSQLGRSNAELNLRLERLSTGLRINRGKDDPAGLIISERIRSDIEGVNQGIKNSERASSVIATAEASLTEVNDLLNSIRSLVVEAANSGAFSDEERRANQDQIDSAIESITRISNTATFGGLNLLNGSLDYTLSGVDRTQISKAEVNGASFVGTNELQVDVEVIASAQTGALFLRGDQPAPGDPANGTALSTTTLRITGNDGVQEYTFNEGTTFEAMVTAINRSSSFTGVEAELINGNAASGIAFRSTSYGSDAFVSVERIGDKPKDPSEDWFETFAIADNAPVPSSNDPFPWGDIGTFLTSSKRDKGQDVAALINGALANGNGLNVTVNSQELSLDLLLNEEFATDPNSPSSSFNITGGGATFQLGPQVTPQQQANVGVRSVAASLLGGTLIDGNLEFLSSLKSDGKNSLRESQSRNDWTAAQDILSKSIDEVSSLRGKLGAFERNVLQTNTRSLQASFENLSASASQIRDADFALETSQLTRAQILASSGTTVLGLANQQAQQALQLLG